MDKKFVSEIAGELEAALSLLRRTHFTAEDSSGLRKSEKFMLMHITHLGDKNGVMPSEIAKHLGVTLGAVTHQINSLEERGYVERISSDDDRRVTFIKLSKKGAELVQALHQKFHSTINNLVDYLGDKDSRELVRLIRKITDFTLMNGGNERA